MEKEKVIEKINSIIDKRGRDKHIKNVLESVKVFVESQTGFDYFTTMEYIQSQMSEKLGGIYIYSNKALEFLKNELKTERKKQKYEQRASHSGTGEEDQRN